VLVMHLMFTKCYRFRGQIFASYLIWYGAERFFVEGLRADSLMLGPVRVSQLAAIAAIAVGATLLVWLPRYDKKRSAQEETATEEGLILQEDEENGSDY